MTKCRDNWQIAEEMKALFVEQGLKLLHDRDFEQAIALFDQLLQLDPNYTEAWNCRGSVFGHLKHYPECIESFDRAIDPNHASSWVNRGKMLAKLGREKSVWRLLKEP